MQLRDAAETLGVHYQTVYGWVRQGTLPARKTPHGYEVSEEDVRDLLARRAVGAEPSPEIQVRDWAAQAERLHAALAEGDEARARHDFGRLAGESRWPNCATWSSPRPCGGSARTGPRASCPSPSSTARPRSASG